MINGFIVDEALWDITTPLWGTRSQQYGYPTEPLLNYFVDLQHVSDVRDNRLLVAASTLKGRLELLFDNTKLPASEQAILNNILTDDVNSSGDKLWNIIEYLELTTGFDKDAMNAHLTSDSIFSIYKDGSLDLGTDRGTIQAQSVSGETQVSIISWIKFTIVDDDNNELDIRIWFNNSNFLNSYPHTTIVKVVSPLSRDDMLNLNDYTTVLETISKTSLTLISNEDEAVENDDHSGIVPFQTRYINNSTSTTITFGVMYKGIRPTNMQCIASVREYLLYNDSPAPEATWRALFPDLFIDGAFFLMPMWGNAYQSTPALKVYTSITNYKAIREEVQSIFPDYDEGVLNNYLQIVTTSSCEVLIGAVPDPTNPEEVLSLKDKFPTYVGVDGVDPNSIVFNSQDAETKNFNELLSASVGVALGSVNIDDLLLETVSSKKWLTYSANFCKIYVLLPPNWSV